MGKITTKVNLLDASGNEINPATEDTLALVLSSTGGVATAMSDGTKSVNVTNTSIAIGSAACKTVFITAKTTNTDVVVVGGASVVFNPLGSRTGKILYAGDSITIAIDNLNKVYINGDAGNGVTFSYTT